MTVGHDGIGGEQVRGDAVSANRRLMRRCLLGLLVGVALFVLHGCATPYAHPYYAMGPGIYGASYYGVYGYRNYYYGSAYRPWRGGGWHRGGGWYHGGWRR